MKMKVKKMFLLLILLSFAIHACTNNNLSTQKEKEDMTIEQLIDSTLSHIQRYDYEPLYMIHVESDASVIIKVNDCRIFSYFGIMSNGISAHINDAILQSGSQKVNIELYPSYLDKKIQHDFLTNQNQLKITVTKSHWEKDGSGMSDHEVVAQYDLQEAIRKKGIDMEKKNLFADTLNFKAEVPYVLTGWSKSKDLTQMNRQELEEKVLMFYTRYRSYYVNKDADKINEETYKRELETSQAAYFGREDIANQKNATDKFFEKYEIDVLPLENYELQFFGNGRMVGLVRTDNKNRGQSALRYRYTNSAGFRRVSMPSVMLHIPEDGNELELIR